MKPQNRIQWLSDLVRLEIALWEQVDSRLRRQHNVSLAAFETIYHTNSAPDGSLRVGDLARAVGITVGAASKLADRVEAAGLIRRQPDADDRRASRIALTQSGQDVLSAATTTYTAELGALLDSVLTEDEQKAMHALVKRLLAVAKSENTL